MALWSGRFGQGPGDEMAAFSQSLDVDLRMAAEDITGSKAHVDGLVRAGILTEEEGQRLQSGLDQVAAELADGRYKPGPELEDIHTAVETRLTAIVGDVGAKLHTARSRNDQVATDVRLWLRKGLDELHAALVDLVAAIVDRVEKDGDVLMPGYTHLQRGQPVLLGHTLLAYAWMVRRDAGRVADARARADASPLGAGAMAGTPHAVDRRYTAERLGFAGPVENAMDAVSARDHALEATAACAIAMSHFSRMGEDLVNWSSREFRFVRLSDAWSTGSSIMPQKRNPDAAELVRGKAGRVFGDLTALLALTKGLPLAYDRDLQEDRHALFDAVETTIACTRVLSGVWRTLTVDRARFEDELRSDFLLATELADWLAAHGVPFREAHHAVARLVADREGRGLDFAGLTIEDLRSFHAAFTEDALTWLEPRAAVERRKSLGGTASSEVARQVGLLRAWVAG